jgi:hypothetical protein
MCTSFHVTEYMYTRDILRGTIYVH